LISKNKIEDQ